MVNWNALTWSEGVATGKDGLRHMLTTLCLKCDDNFRLFSTKERLGALMELSTRRVTGRVDELETCGLVTQIRRVRPNGSEAKPITLLNHPDAPHMRGKPVVLDYEGKYLYPREPHALHAAGIRWVAGGVELGVHPNHQPVDNSEQHDEASPCQHDESSPPGDDEASPPKHSPLKAVPSSSFAGTGARLVDEEEEEPTTKEPAEPADELVREHAEARFGRGRYLKPDARAACVRLVAEHRAAGWPDAKLAAYLRDWAGRALNPSTYLVTQLEALGAPPKAAARRERSVRAPADERPVPASDETRQRVMREVRSGRSQPRDDAPDAGTPKSTSEILDEIGLPRL